MSQQSLINPEEVKSVIDWSKQPVAFNSEYWEERVKVWLGGAEAVNNYIRNLQPTLANENTIAEVMKQVRVSKDQLNSVRLASTLHHRNAQKYLNALFKPVTNALDDADSILKSAVHVIKEQKALAATADRQEREDAHATRMAGIKRDADERVRQAQTQHTMQGNNAKQIEQQAAQQQVHEESAPPLTREQDSVNSPIATVEPRYVDEVDVFDVAQLPRGYMMPNMKKIKADAHAGVAIPGVRVNKREVHVTRKT